MLLKFKMKKLIRKRSVGLLSLATLIVTTVLTLLPLLSAQYYTQDQISTGLQAVKQEKKITLENAELLTDTNVEEEIRQVESLYRNAVHTSSEGGSEYLDGSAYWQNIAPKEGLLNLIAKAQVPIGQTVDYFWLNILDLSAEPLFYQKIDGQRRQLFSEPG